MAGELEEPDIESPLKTRTGKPNYQVGVRFVLTRQSLMVKAGERITNADFPLY
jgi:hypothetical protein